MRLPQNVLYFGKDEPLPEQKLLRAGPLSLVYEAGDLRYVTLADREILRRVYVAVRDHNWDTILPVLTNVTFDIGSDSFRIGYDVANKQGDIDFFWQGTITGDAQGTITFTMTGEARSTFRRNRIGFCVLFPMDCTGVTCQITHVDGSVEASDFPVYIGPQLNIDGIIQPVHPFSEMRAMTYQIEPGLAAEIRYDGDTFEMEDQRNWTDASYKTYSTPLRLPFPVEVTAGTKIVQTVTLSLKGEISPVEPVSAATEGLTFSVSPTSHRPLPRLGLGTASHGQPLSQTEIDRLKALNPAHLRLGLRLFEARYEAKLRQAATEAGQLGVPLEVALFLSNEAATELQALVAVLERIKPSVWAWLIFHEAEKSTSAKWVALAHEHLAGYDPAAKIGSGTNLFFTELNRDRPAVEVVDLVCYSLNPQVHAFDNLSLVETLEAQAATVKSARQFCGDRPLAITPVTLKMRFNPNATGPEPEPGPDELPPQVDVRQLSLFGAGWTAGSLKYLMESDTASLTYYETTGWRGVMETEAGSPIPGQFPSWPGSVFPLYHVLADVGEFAGGEVVSTISSNKRQVEGLAIRKDSRTRVILANLSGNPQQVAVRNLAEQVEVRQLDESNVEHAMRSPGEFRSQVGRLQQTVDGTLRVSLLPYAIARIDDRVA